MYAIRSYYGPGPRGAVGEGRAVPRTVPRGGLSHVDAVVDITVLALLAVTAIALLRLRNLFAVVMLSGIYSSYNFV